MNTTSQRKSMGLGAALLAVLVMLMLTLAPVPADTQAANVQPALLALAAEQPDEQVRVIIQKNGSTADIEAAITRLGGTVIHDLTIINAVVAEIGAETAVNLSYNPAVSWVSLDAPVTSTGQPGNDWPHVYTQAIEANDLWAEGVTGEGVTVAVVDSGIVDWDDFKDYDGDLRILDWVQYAESTAYHGDDYYGHGNHVAGIIAGNGALSEGEYSGVAPEANLINVKISNDVGQSYSSDVVAGLEWILNYKDQYNIRVVNLSLNSVVEESYHTNAITAALEILWFNDIVVVVSAGNNGNDSGVLYPPANDPFVITVGASDDRGTVNTNDDVMASFSDYGLTQDGFMKPDIVAPGTNIISNTGKPDAILMTEHPDRLVAPPNDTGLFRYFRMSGTSMASAVTAGAAALLLSDEPDLTPDQVKYRLTHSTYNQIEVDNQDGDSQGEALPYLNAYDAVWGTTTASANVGVMPHEMLAKMALIAYWSSANGDETIDWATVDWDAVNWDNVDWDAVDWNSVNWGSVNWGSVNWGSVNWGSVNWGSVNWGSVNWGSVNWGSVNWGSVNWGSVNWGSVNTPSFDFSE